MLKGIYRLKAQTNMDFKYIHINPLDHARPNVFSPRRPRASGDGKGSGGAVILWIVVKLPRNNLCIS